MQQPNRFSLITARALSSLASLLELASPLLAKGGSLVCYKTHSESEELEHARNVARKLGMEFVSSRGFTLSDGETSRAIIVFRKRWQPFDETSAKGWHGAKEAILRKESLEQFRGLFFVIWVP